MADFSKGSDGGKWWTLQSAEGEKHCQTRVAYAVIQLPVMLPVVVPVHSQLASRPSLKIGSALWPGHE